MEVAAAKQMADQEAAARKRAEEERKRAEDAAATVAAAAEKKVSQEVCAYVCVCEQVNQNTTSACTFTLCKSLARLETCERNVQVQLVSDSISFSVLCTSNSSFHSYICVSPLR